MLRETMVGVQVDLEGGHKDPPRSPSGKLVSFQGICISQSMNNIAKYSALIELLSDAISLGIRQIIIRLDSQLIVLQITNIYTV